jgi:hypothetical protein
MTMIEKYLSLIEELNAKGIRIWRSIRKGMLQEDIMKRLGRMLLSICILAIKNLVAFRGLWLSASMKWMSSWEASRNRLSRKYRMNELMNVYLYFNTPFYYY